MRLTDAEVHQLIHAISAFLQNGPAELRLYGSRLDDHLQTDGIDLLIITEQVDYADNLLRLKNVILASLKKQMADQKIDLKIAAKEDVSHDPFLKMILPKSVLLYRFG